MAIFYKDNIRYGVAKASFDSSYHTWNEEKVMEIAYIIILGLEEGTFFTDKLFKTKEEAIEHSYDVHDYSSYERSRRRYGYSSYKDRIWVHEYLSKSSYRGVYLPTIGEIKKGMEFIAESNTSQEYNDWAANHKGMTAAQVREELIKDYLED